MTIQNFLKLSACGFIIGISLHANDAKAQAVPAQLQPSQGIVDPARLDNQFNDETTIPDLGRSVEIQRAVIQGAPDNADEIMFELRNLSIEGVSAYGQEDLASIYQDKLGTTVSLADIYAIANRLTNKYRNEGYILTQVVVPPQTIDGGNVKLRVVEGFVDRVVVQGDNDPSALALIQKYANNIGNFVFDHTVLK